MIDGIKLFFEATVNQIEKLKNIKDFIGKFSTATGEIKNRYKAKNKSIEITIIGNKNVIIQGSLHKYYFGGNNSGDFTYSQLKDAINRLCNELNIEAKKMKIQRLEIGVNKRTSPINFDEIEDNLISYKLQPFEPYKMDGKNFGYHCKLQRFEIKIYDKGAQLRIGENIVRFEYKIFKMIHIETFGINFLSDLVDKNKLILLFEAFIRDFSNIRMDNKFEMEELINKDKIPHHDAIFYLKARNTKHWIALKRTQKSSIITSHKRRFDRILKQYSSQNLTLCITDILKDKIQKLILT